MAKENKRYEEGDRYQLKSKVILGMIEKLKLELVIRETNKNERNLSKETEYNMSKLISNIDEEIKNATHEYQQRLEELVDKQDKEMKEFKEELKKELDELKYESSDLLKYKKSYDLTMKENELLWASKIDKDIEKQKKLDEEKIDIWKRKKYNEAIINKENELKKQMISFKTKEETKLREIQIKWFKQLDSEKKKNIRKSMNLEKSNKMLINDQRVEVEHKNPRLSIGQAIFGPRSRGNRTKLNKNNHNNSKHDTNDNENEEVKRDI